MDKMNVSESAPGRLVRYDRRSYYKPDPLPPSKRLDLAEEFYELVSEASFWLGKLNGIGLLVEFSPVLYTSLLRKEAMESAEIEGADIDWNALYSRETRSADGSTPETTDNERMKDVREVLNYEMAVEDGIRALDDGERFSVDLLNTLHATLLSGVRSDTKTVGEKRTTPVNLGPFVPPAPGVVEGTMDALLTYIETGGSYHDLVDIPLVHYQFETIHPYGDGNGRLGRLLIALQLYENGYLEGPTLYLSEYFNRNKQTYIDRMQAVRQHGKWERWLEFFVRGIRYQAEESVERTLSLRELHREYREEFGGQTRTDARLALSLFEQPYITAGDVKSLLDVSGPTAYRAINKLEGEGILEEVTDKEYGREYRAREIFEILERPPQTY